MVEDTASGGRHACRCGRGSAVAEHAGGTAPLVELRDVSFRYRRGEGVAAADAPLELDGVSLAVRRGEVVVLCGESGCGKTTVTRLVNGLIPQYYPGELWGEVLVDGHDVSVGPVAATARLVGSVFQNPRSQFFNVDVESELAFGCENMGWRAPAIREAVGRVAEEFRIRGLLPRSLFKLSGGEKQKVACAGVSAADPAVYVLDEPTANLDVAAMRSLAGILERWKAAGKAVVVAEHRLEYLLPIADRFVLLRAGRVVWDKTAGEVRAMGASELHEAGLRGVAAGFAAREVASCAGEPGLSVRDLSFSWKEGGEDAACAPPPAARTPLRAADTRTPSRGAGVRETAMPARGILARELDVPKGAVAGVVGLNGVGKSTLARCICGLERRAAGTVRIDGCAMGAAARRRASYLVMQDVNHQLFSESVFEEVALSLRAATHVKKGSEAERKRVGEILASLDLLPLAGEHPMALSGGQKQRVAIASAVACGASLMVFDEPTSGLDWKHMLETAENLRALSARGTTSLVVTHDPELIACCCDWVLFVEDGRVAWSRPLDGECARALDRFFSAGSPSGCS